MMSCAKEGGIKVETKNDFVLQGDFWVRQKLVSLIISKAIVTLWYHSLNCLFINLRGSHGNIFGIGSDFSWGGGRGVFLKIIKHKNDERGLDPPPQKKINKNMT